jgi:TolA-binding protein
VALKLALGENILRQGKTAEAKAQFHAIVKDHPGTPEAKVAQDYLDILPEGK